MKILNNIRRARTLKEGLASFNRDEQTPQSAYMALRESHCASAGESTDSLAAQLARLRPAQNESATGLLSSERDEALAALKLDGFFVFSHRLDSTICERLRDFALREPARLNPRPKDAPATARYDASAPLAETYHFEQSQILAQSEVQNLVADASLRTLARDYLGCEPVFDLAAMWWSTPTKIASSAAAQLYHFDMDRVKWLKFFVYLSDVTPSRGPHCYLRGTHKKGQTSKKLLALGDRRIEDVEIESLGLRDLESEICGSLGTILVADTRGHHKGKPPVEDDRLLLQLEFANSLFGAPFEKVSVQNPTPALREAAKAAPSVFSRLTTP